MIYAKKGIWFSPDRQLCELQPDGSVNFAKDITEKEYRWALTALLREYEAQRQASLLRYQEFVKEQCSKNSGNGSMGSPTSL